MFLNKEIYIACRKSELEYDEYGNEKVTYENPVKYEFNVQPLSGSSDVQAYGEKVNTMQRAIISKDLYQGKFKENDLAYLDGQNPDSEEYNGTNANYRISSVVNQNLVTVILFERLVGNSG